MCEVGGGADVQVVGGGSVLGGAKFVFNCLMYEISVTNARHHNQ
jgi:alcohol dehydrogenase YqhD (iron-dependent ADH family)